MLGLGVAAVLGAVVGAFILGGLYWIVTKNASAPTTLVAFPESADLMRNGGFENGDTHWGTGQYEDEVQSGRRPRPQDFPWMPFGPVQSRGRPVPSTGRPSSIGAYLIEHSSPQKNNVVGSLSQRIGGLEPGQYYLVTFFVKVDHADAKDAVFLTADLKWYHRTPLGDDPEWRQREHLFVAESSTADIRFVSQNRARLWIDDVSVRLARPVNLESQVSGKATTRP